MNAGILEKTLNDAIQALEHASERPYGPVFTPEDAKAAGAACVSLCGGDHDQARTLWKLIVSDLGAEYMPRAACAALIRAAATTNLVPDIEAPDLDAPRGFASEKS